jgi:hypothetical protein
LAGVNVESANEKATASINNLRDLMNFRVSVLSENLL